MTSPNFYVYVYLDPRKPGQYNYGEFIFTCEPFYVGKGTGMRYEPRLRHSRQNLYLLNKLLKIESKNVIVCFLTWTPFEKEALQKETELIALIGRSDCGGPLVNMTAGGEGVTGLHLSLEVRQRISASLTGRKGCTHTVESKRKISIKNSGRIFTEAHKQKLRKRKVGKSSSNKGKQHSIETRQKLREAWIKRKLRGDVPWNKGIPGQKQSLETRQKRSESLKKVYSEGRGNRIVSQETREKIRNTLLKRFTKVKEESCGISEL